MCGYEVVLGEIRNAAGAAGSAGDQVAAIALSEATAGAGAALPGSRTTDAIARLGTAWDSRTAGWSADARGYATSLTEAADGYEANEAAAEADLTAAAGALCAG